MKPTGEKFTLKTAADVAVLIAQSDPAMRESLVNDLARAGAIFQQAAAIGVGNTGTVVWTYDDDPSADVIRRIPYNGRA